MSNNLSRRQIIKAGLGLVTGTATSGGVPLITNLIASSTLVSPAQAQTNRLISVLLESGTIISLECLGAISDPRFKYLDGRTADGTVGLAPSFGGEFTGARWRVDRRQSTSIEGEIYYTFYCLGTVPGPNYLDGRTADGTVGLALSYGEGIYTGARWMVYTNGSSFLLYCLGDIDGPRWLDGRTTDGSVGLAPTYEGGSTGTKWRFHLER
jgi:hypothetical protein